jgi:formamidopyrimidine-DNA glycosylase
MPELPEVETTRRGIAPWLEGQRIARVAIHNPRLRWPVAPDLAPALTGLTVLAVDRRAKYLLLRTTGGTALLHLGMSGSLRVLREPRPAGAHDCVDLITDAGVVIRFNDPRRFGSLHWTRDDPESHALLRQLGPEPLSAAFSGGYLHARSRRGKAAIKSHIMNAKVVVGVGNIYASEALHRAEIRPSRRAGLVSLARCEALAAAIKAVLAESIQAGGTTLRDFYSGDGEPGYFARQLRVYDRGGLPCLGCGTAVRRTVTGQRSTYFCPRCQR